MNHAEQALISPIRLSVRMPPDPWAEALDRITEAESLAAVFHAAGLAANLLGFEHFLYCGRFGRGEREPAYLVESNEPQDWVERYRDEEMWRRDPRFAYCLRHASPLLWDWQRLSADVDEPLRRIAESWHIRAGLAVPVHGCEATSAMLCFDSDGVRAMHQDRYNRFSTMSRAMCYAAFIHERVKAILQRSGRSASTPQLSAREQEVLQWLSRGKGAWEIAHIVGIAESTVYFHLRSLKRKLDVSNIPHAVARAMSLGIVAP